MIITQASLRLPTIKATLKCAVVLFFWEGGGCQKTTIYLIQWGKQHITVGQSFDCGLWNVGRLLFSGCAKLPDIGRNWNTLIQSVTNMLSGWHIQWVCWPYKNWDISASRNCVHILAIWGHLSCCNLSWWWWVNGFRIWSGYFYASIKGTCVCRHTPAHAVTPSTNRSPTRRHTHWNLLCPVKTRTHPLREHLFKVPDHIKCEHSPTAAWYDDELQADGAHKEDFPEMVGAKVVWICKRIVAASVRVAGLRPSRRCRCWMWSFRAGGVARDLWSWGRLDVLINSL